MFKVILVTHKGNWNITRLSEGSIAQDFVRLAVALDIDEELESGTLIKATSVCDVIK